MIGEGLHADPRHDHPKVGHGGDQAAGEVTASSGMAGSSARDVGDRTRRTEKLVEKANGLVEGGTVACEFAFHDRCAVVVLVLGWKGPYTRRCPSWCHRRVDCTGHAITRRALSPPSAKLVYWDCMAGGKRHRNPGIGHDEGVAGKRKIVGS